MATLEKIRSKSVLLIVIIGVALLAFIVGDAITNSRNLFGEQTTVAKVGGKKIDYTDYVRKREELNNQLEQMRRQNPQQASQYDSQAIAQQALETLITENLLDEAVEKAGIQTSPSQLKFFVIDNPINVTALRNIMMALANSGIAVQTPAQAYEVIFNPQNNGLTQAQVEPLQRQWIIMENETKKMIARQTYQSLLAGTVRANNLDKKALYNDYVLTRNVEYAFTPYGQLDPDRFAVADAQLRAEYENIKGRYHVDELTKDVAFIAVSVRPSAEDQAAARSLAAKAANEMKSPAGISKDLRKEGILSITKETLTKNLTNGPVKDFVTNAPLDSVKVVTQSPSGFTIVKLKNRSTGLDEIDINVVQAMGTLGNQVLADLNSGLALDSLTSVFPADSIRVFEDQKITLYNKDGRTGEIESEKVDLILNAGGKYVVIDSNDDVTILAQLVKAGERSEVVEYDEVSYELKPSTKTLSTQVEKMEDFLAANPNAKDFIANAAENGYSVRDITLSSSSPAVPNFGNQYFPESRQVVRWVMVDGKPGQVSHIYESKDASNPMLYAVAIIDQYDDYKPLSNTDVNNYVTNRVRRGMAGDSLVAKYRPLATNMANAAQAMNVEAAKDSVFRFGRNPRVRDAEVVGRIAGSQPGNVVVVKGDNGVYAYQVLSTATQNFEYNDAQYERQYGQMVQPDFVEMLKGGKSYKNNIYKFEAGD